MKRDDFCSYLIYIQHNTFAYTDWREALPGPGSGSGWAGACEWQVCDLLLFQSQLQVCQATGVHKMSQICILSWHLLSFIWTAAPVSLKPGRTETDLTQLSLRYCEWLIDAFKRAHSDQISRGWKGGFLYFIDTCDRQTKMLLDKNIEPNKICKEYTVC